MVADDLAAWERLLRGQEGALTGIRSGARVGIVRRQAASSGGEMLVWSREDAEFRVLREQFRGFRAGGVDVVFVVDDETLAEVCRADQEDPLRALRLGIRRGNALLYFLRTKRELRELGYEEFVELVGVPLGGCH